MKRYYVLYVFLTFVVFSGWAERKKVGLVLGGGGAKGAAHVGALKVLEEAGIPVDYITGTSIGAIVGGMYSIGYSAHELDSMFRTQDWAFLFTDNVDRRYRLYSAKEYYDKYLFSLSYSIKQKKENPFGVITGHNIYNLLSNMTIGYHDVESFNDLPVPFACVAVDLVTGQEVILNKGSLPTAMRASMAIPGAFEPVLMNNMVLIDGGMLNNLPADVVIDMGADIVIGIDLSTGWGTADDVKKISGMVDQMVNMMQNDKYEKNRNCIDFYLNPDLKGYGPASFSEQDINIMIQRGEDAARERWNELILLKEYIYGEELMVEDVRPLTYVHRDSIYLGKITLQGVAGNNESWIRKRLPIKENTMVSVNDIEKSIAVLYGMDLFSRVEYKLHNNVPHDIDFILKRKPLNNLNVGLRFDSEEYASILLNTTINHQLLRGSVFSVTGRLNRTPYLQLSARFGGVHNQRFGISYMLRDNDFSIYKKQKKIDSFSFVSHSASIYHSGFGQNIKYNLGVHYDYFRYDEVMYYDYFDYDNLKPEGFFNYFATFTYDSKDETYYPTKGIYTHLHAQVFTDNLISYKDDVPFVRLSYDMNGVIRFSNRFFMIPSIYVNFILGDDIPLIYRNFMGGELAGRYLQQQIPFSGVKRIQLFDNTLLVGKSAFRYRIARNHYIIASGEYAMTCDKLDFSESRHIWGTSLQYSYRSILGPIGFQLNYSSYDKRLNTYVSVGYSF